MSLVHVALSLKSLALSLKSLALSLKSLALSLVSLSLSLSLKSLALSLESLFFEFPSQFVSQVDFHANRGQKSSHMTIFVQLDSICDHFRVIRCEMGISHGAEKFS